MGQQQLLLLVLGIVIVGLAVVAGIQAFSTNQKKANADALALTAMRIASDAQAWLQTPVSFGGGSPATGGRPADFTGLTVDLVDLGYEVNAADEYRTVNGAFTIDNNGSGITVEGISASTSGGGDNNLICVYVSGNLVTDITTTINPTSGSC